MVHIVEKNLRRYFCFLSCCIFIFGVNFGFVNLPRVSAEGQNEVVKLQLIGIKSYYTVQPQELVAQFKFFDNGTEIK